MKRSTERIPTAHTGSLPRPEDLIRSMWRRSLRASARLESRALF